MIIGCDIGGVVKEMNSDNSIKNSIESIKLLEEKGYKIIFISKCGENFQKSIIEWLKQNQLNNKIYFCKEYSQKCALCIENKVNYMIDDKLQVFREIPNSIKKIWLCDDEKKINGAKKFQPNELLNVSICSDWNEIVDLITFN
jgi:3-phosphoglycerate kinase